MTLAMDPTNSALPLSPIFIRTSGDHGGGAHGHGFPGLGLDAASLLDNLDEITSLPHEFLNIGRCCCWGRNMATVGNLNSSRSSVIHQLNLILSFLCSRANYKNVIPFKISLLCNVRVGSNIFQYQIKSGLITERKEPTHF